MTTTRFPQLMLPGQVAAPEGPADMTMMYVMHHAFRRDLRRFAEAATVTPAADTDAWQALAERWQQFADVLHHHHTVEDDWIWPFLLERADEEERKVLLDMEAEHDLIDPQLHAVAEGLAALAAAPAPEAASDLKRGLVVRIAAATAGLQDHLGHEESEALVVLQRRMTAQEWTSLQRRIDAQKPPISLAFLVGWAAEGMPQRERDEVFARAAGPMKLLWLLTRAKFRRGERRAFRYLEL